jgi:phage tail sheath protein FI
VISAVSTSITAFIGETANSPGDQPVAVLSPADFNQTFGAGGAVAAAVHDFFRQGGTIAMVARDLDSLRAAGAIFNLLVVPGDPSPEVAAGAVALAAELGGFCILDPPAAWTTIAQAAAGATSPAFAHSPNAAVYFPRIAQPGPVRGPAGAVAGIIARNDVVRGVWAAPAGVDATLRGVTALDLQVADADSARLNPLGVNCLRSFAGAGPVVWGARTTETADAEWRYVNVRRTAVFLERSIGQGTQWATFEPNSEPLWARLRTEIGAFLDELFRAEAFAGTTARDAYFVKCDRDTTTQADIDNGIANVQVGFAPLRPAEFVVIHIRLQTGRDTTSP